MRARPAPPWRFACAALLAALETLAMPAARAADVTGTAAATGTTAVDAQGVDAHGAGAVLLHYLAGLRTLQTDFTQTVTDAHGKPVETGHGRLLVQRPGRFRWDYQPGPSSGGGGVAATDAAGGDQSGQLLVSDGRNVWFYDRELAQVTVKPIDAALTSTPIMLLSGDSQQLQQHFEMSALAPHEGLQWVQVTPRSDQADFLNAQIGLHANALVRMLVHDRLGQTVRLDFSHSERNRPIAPAEFQFKRPPGVDLIGTPVN